MINPSDWILRFKDQIPNGSNLLDLACGSGRHGRLFMDKSCHVTFLDKNIEGVLDLEDHSNSKLLSFDLENSSPWPFEASSFDAIIVTNYLHRPLFPKISETLTKNGVLIYETFGVGQEKFGRPSNPDFLLKPNELFQVFQKDLNIIAFEQGILNGQKVVQRICAVKSSNPVDYS